MNPSVNIANYGTAPVREQLMVRDNRTIIAENKPWTKYFSFIDAAMLALLQNNPPTAELDYGVRATWWPGLVADGSDVTAEVMALMAAGYSHIHFPAGNYGIQPIAIPTTVKMISGDGAGTIFTPIGPATSAPFDFTGHTNLILRDFTVNAARATWAAYGVISLHGVDGFHIENIQMAHSGGAGIAGYACSNGLVTNCHFDDWALFGILFNTAGSKNIIVNQCFVDGTNGTYHGIQLADGTGMRIHDCDGQKCPVFNFNLDLCSFSSITICRGLNSVHECCNLDGCSDSQMIGNIGNWTGSISQDFGMSVYGGGAVACDRNLVAANTVTNTGKAGYALAGDSGSVSWCSVLDNKSYNPNQMNQTYWGGVTIYGVNGIANHIEGNYAYSDDGKMLYGFSEWTNGGLSIPSLNWFVGNRSVGHTTAPVLLGSATSRTDEWITSTIGPFAAPTITAGNAVAFTALGTTVVKCRADGNTCEFIITVPITTNGGAATSVIATIPYTAAVDGRGVGGIANGRADAVSKKQLQGRILANTVEIFNYDNTYPGANGEVLYIEGSFQIA